MKHTIVTHGEFTVVTIQVARLDAALAPQFKSSIETLIKAGNNRLILDLHEVQFMDSSSLGALVSLLKLVGNRGDLIIAGATGIVADLFKLTRMDRVFRITPDVTTALETVAA